MSSSPQQVKVHSLTGRIEYPGMLDAFKKVRRNRGAAGIDQQSIGMFESNLDQNLMSLMRDLKTRGSFQPQPLRRVYIDKSPTQKRPIGIPVVRDRVAQEVLRCLLSPVFERHFHDDSYGFRPRRNCHQALARIEELHSQGYNHVLDADIQGFFDSIPHEVIMAVLRAEVADGNILALIESFLRSGVVEDGVLKPTTVGTPQGGVISPLLANIVLNRLDWQLHEHGYHFVRYADDFVVLCKTAKQAEEAKALVHQVLTGLGLTLHPTKTRCTTYRKGFEFLGFAIGSRSMKMRPKAVEGFREKARKLTRRNNNLDAKVIDRINALVRGTAKYFGTSFSSCVKQFQKLDQWLRMRLRCMKYKRKSARDNMKLRTKYLRSLLSLEALLKSAKVA